MNLDAGAIYFGLLTVILTPILCLIALKSRGK